MILEWLQQLGPWAWLIVGLLLLVAEAVVPGIFLIWFGLAAITVGLLAVMPFAVAWLPWQMEFVAFGILSLIYIVVGTRIFPTNGKDGDAAGAINDPLSRHIGKEIVLEEAIVGGTGRVRIGDTTWRVSGPPLKAGEMVRVVAAKNEALVVEAVS